MKYYYYIALFLCTFFGILGGKAQAQPRDSVLVLDRLIQQALNRNPDLQSSHDQIQVQRSQVSQEGALPDPELGLGLMSLPIDNFRFDQYNMTGKAVSLTQMIPFPGKLGLKKDIGRSETRMARQQYQQRRNQLIKNVKQAYFELAYTEKALETVRENIGTMKTLVTTAETRYSVGGGQQQDVMRAQVELSRMIDKQISLRQKREVQQARINTLIAQPADAPLGNPMLPAYHQTAFRLDSLNQTADANSPLLAAWKTMVSRSGQKVDLALKDRYPDFSIGATYLQRQPLQNGRDGDDFLSGMIGIKLPLFYGKKQKQKVQEMRFNESSMERRYRSVQNTVDQLLQQSLTDLQKNARLVELYKTGVIPQAEQSLESSLAGYQNGKVDFLSLLDSELSVFNIQLDYYRFLSDYHKSIAELEALSGTQF